ncbi:MAG: sugar kinase [Spirochaetales bacterium]|nr:sugar kinase [Spirochaetales bacterium]MCF7938076.1 sugar kinase [Spirochaetales bacterium]
MASLQVPGPKAGGFDLVSLGEIMLRFDPGDERVRTARNFRVWEGGGEYNVARALRRCFGLKTAAVTALVDNDIGRLIEDCILQGGVDTGWISWLPFDGVGRQTRNGLNFTERGFGLRGARGIYDRGHSAAAAMKPGDVDWEALFDESGVRWLHTGGIFAALSETTPAVIEEAFAAARNRGIVISYDLNYRPSLWKQVGGHERAIEVNRRLAPYLDVIIGNEEDFTAALGLPVEGTGSDFDKLPLDSYRRMIDKAVSLYPNFRVIATTLRKVISANRNDWGAILWEDGVFYQAAERPGLEVYDRVGGGDSFASGMIYAYLTGMGARRAVDYGAAHGALAMTTPGDTSMAGLEEVRKLAEEGGTARIDR